MKINLCCNITADRLAIILSVLGIIGILIVAILCLVFVKGGFWEFACFLPQQIPLGFAFLLVLKGVIKANFKFFIVVNVVIALNILFDCCMTGFTFYVGIALPESILTQAQDSDSDDDTSDVAEGWQSGFLISGSVFLAVTVHHILTLLVNIKILRRSFRKDRRPLSSPIELNRVPAIPVIFNRPSAPSFSEISAPPNYEDDEIICRQNNFRISNSNRPPPSYTTADGNRSRINC